MPAYRAQSGIALIGNGSLPMGTAALFVILTFFGPSVFCFFTHSVVELRLEEAVLHLTSWKEWKHDQTPKKLPPGHTMTLMRLALISLWDCNHNKTIFISFKCNNQSFWRNTLYVGLGVAGWLKTNCFLFFF